MAAWTVTVTDNFLNELISLPAKVAKKVSKQIKVLQKDPISAQKDAQKLKDYHNNVYRVRIGDYRIFYSFGRGWIKMLSVRKRDDLTYKQPIPEFTPPPPPPKRIEDWGKQETVPEPESNDQTKPTDTNTLKFAAATLEKWRIPEQYWSEIMAVTDSDSILDLTIPQEYLNRILDYLYPPTLEEIEVRPEYVLQKPEDLERYFEGEISTFLLKLDPEQEKLGKFGKSGPIVVKGGPGTGKSTLALYRVAKLLELGYTSILFTTYTNALVKYSQQLLHQLLGKPPEDLGVKVTTVDSLIYRHYAQQYGKPNIAPAEDSRRCLQIALQTTSVPGLSLFDTQVSRQTLSNLGIDYLLQEILEVIEGHGLTSLEEYQGIPRIGRGVPLQSKSRRVVWAVYETWTELMAQKQQLTWEQLRHQVLQAQQHQPQTPPYQAAIVDEAQDLSPVALRFLLNLLPDFSGLYLTADASQSIYQKGFSWRQVHQDLRVTGRTFLLKRNYRNTRQISTACATILAHTEAGDRECISQESSPYEGDPPLVWMGKEEEEEMITIYNFLLEAAKQHRLPLHGSAIVTPSSQGAKDYAAKLSELGLQAKFVASKNIDLEAPYVKVMTLHSAKGLEFPFVVIGLSGQEFPNIEEDLHSGDREAQYYAQLRLFYVGCSRAMRSLLVTQARPNPCQFLRDLDQEAWHFRD